MQRKCFLAMIAAILSAGCGDSRDSDIAHTNSTEGQDEAVTAENDGFEFNGLYWQVGPDRDMTWDEAKAWVDGLGGNWRMPTRAELRSLWDAGISLGNWGLFENTGWWVWSGEVRDSSSAWPFFFLTGLEDWRARSFSTHGRAFAVRHREGQDETITAGKDCFMYNGLRWQVGPDHNMNWDEAKAWVDGLGENWRMATRAELQGLWDAGIRHDDWGPFENNGRWVWSGEVRGSSMAMAWGFLFDDGNEDWFYRSASGNLRAFAVRPR